MADRVRCDLTVRRGGLSPAQVRAICKWIDGKIFECEASSRDSHPDGLHRAWARGVRESLESVRTLLKSPSRLEGEKRR